MSKVHLKNFLLPHPSAALEYWFFKVNSGPIAILVDWIAYRKTKQNWLRVSIHSPHKRVVLSEKLIKIMPLNNFLSIQRTVGQIGDIAWELDIDPGKELIQPDIFPSALLHMTDILLLSAPLARFSGWISHGGQRFKMESALGMLSHYWGRQLSSDWWWISANQFQQEGVSVECSFVKSSLWGTPLKAAFAYLYLRQQEKKEFVMALPGMASVKGTCENFELKINRIGKEPIVLIGRGLEYGYLGDGIVNTLIGDLEIRVGDKLMAQAIGTAGIECRSSNHLTIKNIMQKEQAVVSSTNYELN